MDDPAGKQNTKSGEESQSETRRLHGQFNLNLIPQNTVFPFPL
jgi:hypothetical protein